MYSVTIPVMLRDDFDRDDTLSELKRAGADRVLLAVNRAFRDGRIDTEIQLDRMKECIRDYENTGLDVGVWLGETMGHGWGPVIETVYTPFTSINGRKADGGFCCADENFRRDVCIWAANAAEAGAKLILLDDDWRMSSHGDGTFAGCMCEDHIRRYCEMAGETLTREEIAKKVFTGSASRYREIWQQLMGGDMLRLAREIREAVDAVNPECRIGLCTAPSVVDLDGSDFMEITSALAGNTRPYVRLIGAPYWAKCTRDLTTVITTERMIAHFAKEWKEKTNAEVLAEGDVYPRPRTACPAAYLEIFDQILRADGNFTGIQKYMMDYGKPARWEHGFIDKHVKNRALAEQITELFAGRIQTGFRAWEFRSLFAGADLPEEDPAAGNLTAYEQFRGLTTAYLTDASVPVSFDSGITVVFGENAKYIPEAELKNGAVLDLTAADILRKRGIDTGSDPADSGIARHENAEGQRFAVCPFHAVPNEGTRFFRNYDRQRELYEIGGWISRRPVSAMITDCPDAYIMTAEDEMEKAVGLWNVFEDAIDEPVITLADEPKNIRFVNCTGCADGNRIKLSEILPFGFAGFTYEV
ncbi:MAG: hypothetical protein IJF78_12950 [Clostridia bacterium]|nr:hypothetical protein [Clostridia bacterium]